MSVYKKSNPEKFINIPTALNSIIGGGTGGGSIDINTKNSSITPTSLSSNSTNSIQSMVKNGDYYYLYTYTTAYTIVKLDLQLNVVLSKTLNFYPDGIVSYGDYLYLIDSNDIFAFNISDFSLAYSASLSYSSGGFTWTAKDVYADASGVYIGGATYYNNTNFRVGFIKLDHDLTNPTLYYTTTINSFHGVSIVVVDNKITLGCMYRASGNCIGMVEFDTGSLVSATGYYETTSNYGSFGVSYGKNKYGFVTSGSQRFQVSYKDRKMKQAYTNTIDCLTKDYLTYRSVNGIYTGFTNSTKQTLTMANANISKVVYADNNEIIGFGNITSPSIDSLVRVSDLENVKDGNYNSITSISSASSADSTAFLSLSNSIALSFTSVTPTLTVPTAPTISSVSHASLNSLYIDN